MNNLKVGDTFEFAINPIAKMLHEAPTICIVLKANVKLLRDEEYFTCSQCPLCKVMTGTCLWSRNTSLIFHQALVGNKKLIVGVGEKDYKVRAIWCPESQPK